MTVAPLIVVSGPSGSGKSTLIRFAVASFPGRLRHAVSATTRPPRPGEIDGREYHFWDRSRFEAGIAAGEFLEYATVFAKHCYGTPRSEVEPFRSAGVGVIIDIDVQGAEQVRHTCPDAYTIFLDTPPGAYEARLRARGTESEGALQRRLETAAEELRRAKDFNYRLLNDDVDRASRELADVIARLFEKPT